MAKLGILVVEEAERSAMRERDDSQPVCCRQTRWMADIVRLYATLVLPLIINISKMQNKTVAKETYLDIPSPGVGSCLFEL